MVMIGSQESKAIWGNSSPFKGEENSASYLSHIYLSKPTFDEKTIRLPMRIMHSGIFILVKKLRPWMFFTIEKKNGWKLQVQSSFLRPSET